MALIVSMSFAKYLVKNQKIDKEKSTEKVDGAVAMVMALARAIANVGGSVYDDDEHGLFLL